MANTHLTILLSDVEARLRNIESNIGRQRIPVFEERLNRCNAMFENILDMARFQCVELTDHYHALTGIRTRLLEVQDLIEAKRNVWWRRLLRPIAVGVDLIARIMGLSPIFRKALPPSRDW